MRPVSWDEWIELARQDMAREQELHPLWPVQQFLDALGTELEVNENEGDEWEMREVLAAARQNMEYLRGKGFFSSRGSGGKPISGKVMTRTRNIRATGLKAVSS